MDSHRQRYVITCFYGQLRSKSVKTQLELSTDGGNIRNTVVCAGVLQGSWDSEESYSVTEVFGEEGTMETMTFTIRCRSLYIKIFEIIILLQSPGVVLCELYVERRLNYILCNSYHRTYLQSLLLYMYL